MEGILQIHREASKRILDLERERDEAMRERDDAREALKRLKKELAAANKGAETNAKVNQILCKKLSEAESERDEARRKLEEARKALRWIAGRYCYEKTTVALANEAYEMSSTARWTLQELEKKEEA